MNNPLPLLLAVLTITGECLWSAIQQLGELLTSRTGFIGEFITCESGRGRPQQAIPVAWTGGLLIAATVILSTPHKAAAHCPHWGYDNCDSTSQCLNYCIVRHGCWEAKCKFVESENKDICRCRADW